MKKTVLIAAIMALGATGAFAQSANLGEPHLNALDKDGDGAISREEFFDFATFAFNKMDTNGNATLSADEVDDHLVPESFDQLDKDGDGAVTTAEFGQQMDADFREADKDGDGILN